LINRQKAVGWNVMPFYTDTHMSDIGQLHFLT